MEGGYTIQIVENTDQGKFCSPLIVSSFSITQGMFIREINAKISGLTRFCSLIHMLINIQKSPK